MLMDVFGIKHDATIRLIGPARTPEQMGKKVITI